MRPKSVYDAWLDVETDTIYVRDLNIEGSLSVTNDAENVVRDVVARFGEKQVLYYDSEGDLDEIVHSNGTFLGFAPGPNRRK